MDREQASGALWKKRSERGDYFTGEINGERIVVFANSFKGDNVKAPDFKIYKSKPRDDARD
jgi:hypothetical protein